MTRFSTLLVLAFVLVSLAAAAKPPKVDLDANVFTLPRGEVMDVEVNAPPLWTARSWGDFPKSLAAAPQCGPGTTVTFAVPPNLPRRWTEARLNKWLRQLAAIMRPPDTMGLVPWQFGRTAINPRQVRVYCLPEPAPTGADNPIFGWAVGTQLVYTDAATGGGPRAIGVEFAASLNLRILDWMWFRMEFSPGYAWGVDGEAGSSFSIAEFPALEFRLKHLIATVGVRHRVAFNAESDDFNILAAEIAASTYVWHGLQLGLGLNLGGGWFPIYESVDRALLPYWVDVPPVAVTAGSGFAWGLTFKGLWQF